jgi:hypothetical protein
MEICAKRLASQNPPHKRRGSKSDGTKWTLIRVTIRVGLPQSEMVWRKVSVPRLSSNLIKAGRANRDYGFTGSPNHSAAFAAALAAVKIARLSPLSTFSQLAR